MDRQDMVEAAYSTPNTQIPLNNRPIGQLAAIAQQQLKPFEEAADQWPMFEFQRDGRLAKICRLCDQVQWYRFDEQGQPYHYSVSELKAILVAHIRRQHEKVVRLDAKGNLAFLDIPNDDGRKCGYPRYPGGSVD
jgi:hypothetical protein